MLASLKAVWGYTPCLLRTGKPSVGKRKKRIVVTGILLLALLLVLVLLVVVFTGILCGPSTRSPDIQVTPQLERNLSAAVTYLKSHFNPKEGLLYESEDSGNRTIGGCDYRYDQIYWLYSDNLLASWALKPYDAELSSTINQTIHSYTGEGSGFFEVLFGYPISQDMSEASQLVVAQDKQRVVLAEFHNSSTPLDWRSYGDTLIYRSLNEYLKGNRTAANQYFREAYMMFDGKGVYDLATQTDGRYATYKLALILYASKVLDYPVPYNVTKPNYNPIEDRLWSMQQENGGITSLSDLDGKPVGSANTETTAITLLPYNDELIAKMHSLFGAYQPKK
ncbi:hypothetical protein HY605_03640 [Candidatus Peregrinibacteria bacterium]|nr:hypothetical protein [Candidatus Peregrinibacteria bacterium]